MVGLGTVINVAAIVLGGGAGHFIGKALPARCQESLNMACGVSVLFIGIAGAMEGMLRPEGSALVSGRSLLVVLCLALGALVGELVNIEGLVRRFGEWLKDRTGNAGERRFVEGFVTASLTVCIGAMAVVGSIQDGLNGDCSVLVTKSILDFIIIMVMTSSLGRGCIFSAVPVALWEGGVTLLARLLRPVMTAAALSNLSLVGSVLIFCVGLNLLWGQKVRVANLLPAILLAVCAAFLPFDL